MGGALGLAQRGHGGVCGAEVGRSRHGNLGTWATRFWLPVGASEDELSALEARVVSRKGGSAGEAVPVRQWGVYGALVGTVVAHASPSANRGTVGTCVGQSAYSARVRAAIGRARRHSGLQLVGLLGHCTHCGSRTLNETAGVTCPYISVCYVRPPSKVHRINRRNPQLCLLRYRGATPS